MIKQLLLSIVLILGFGFNSTFVEAQEDNIVYAVLFYSPTCPHCHKLIGDDLPPVQEQFGDTLMIFFIDVSTESGGMLAQSAYAHYQIPQDSWVVPMMVINEQVLIGGVQIPTQLPIIARTGLENGGIPVPQFPLMQTAFEQWQSQNPTSMAEVAPSDINPLVASFEHDPLASMITIVILVLLIISVITMFVIRRRSLPIVVPQVIVLGATLMLFFLALTIILADQQDNFALPIATLTIFGAMLSSGFAIFGKRVRPAVIILTIIGLAISLYMAYIELTTNPAVCGTIGDCNAVQQSGYAYLLGIPIGVIGVIGYLLMFAISLLLMRVPQHYLSPLATLFKVLVSLSTLFTIYLTFLEPFVIGAVCAWCLMSALVVLSLMWLVIPMIHTSRSKPIQYLLYQP